MKEFKNKLVIIGNGFDLAHNLKTSYTDFIAWYLNDCIEKWNTSFDFEDELIHLFKGAAFPTKILMSKDFQIQYLDNLVQNGHLKYSMSRFLRQLVNNSEINRWVDIETEYYKNIVRFFHTSDSPVSQKSTMMNLNKDFGFIKQKLEEYLTTVQFSIKKKEIAINYDINSLFQSDFSIGYSEDDKIIKQIHYLNFNYTKTIEDYICNDTNYELNYIHGQLNNKENPIVFGYGDEIDSYYGKIEDLNDNEFLKNFKSFAYFKNENYQKLLRFIDAEPYDIVILGHSCGLSDRVLLNTIFEHDNCWSIKIHYYQKNVTENDFTAKTQEISRHFKDKAKMRRRVVNFKDCKPLVALKNSH